jgi:alpha-1,3-glucan synthase
VLTPPGWWYTVESTTTKHLQNQFKSAIEDALASKTEERALMRAKSAKQRFPVARWVEDLNILESTAIRVHNEEASGHRRFRPSSANRFLHSITNGLDKQPIYDDASAQAEAFAASGQQDTSSAGLHRSLSLGVRNGPGHRARLTGQQIVAPVQEADEENEDERNSADEYRLTHEQAEDIVREIERSRALRRLNRSSALSLREPEGAYSDSRGRERNRSPPAHLPTLRYSRSPYDMERSGSPSPNDSLLRRISRKHSRRLGRPNDSLLDLTAIRASNSDFNLQMVDPTFNDTTGEFFKAFEHMLQRLDAKKSEKELCIEEYLIESEKTWFKRFRQAKLNRSRGPSPMGSPNPSVSSLSNYRSYRSYQSSPAPSERNSSDNESTMDTTSLADDEFLLGKDYQRPSAPKRLMQRRIGDWPIYSLILALGQILAANSYQITLLTGGQGQTPEKLYIIGGIYMAMTCVWWAFYRKFKSLYVLSVPFAIYGLAFVFVGMAPFLGRGSGRDTMRNVATGLYTAASASGSIFFALNFGDDGKTTFSI